MPDTPIHNDLALEIIQRLTRIEEGQQVLHKHVVTGNGVPSLLKRVDDLEKDRDEGRGTSTVKKAIYGFIVALTLSVGGYCYKFATEHVAAQNQVQHQLQMSDQQMSDDIKVVQRDVQTIQQQIKDHDLATRPQPKRRGR